MQRGGDNTDDGFIMVDALTGVVIISMMVAVCLGTVKIARAFSQTAGDMKAANALLASLMETTPRIVGQYNGTSGGLRYEVEVTDDRVDKVQLCQIHAVVKTARSGHIYRLNGTRWCEAVT